jgi:hypothetical protein
MTWLICSQALSLCSPSLKFPSNERVSQPTLPSLTACTCIDLSLVATLLVPSHIQTYAVTSSFRRLCILSLLQQVSSDMHLFPYQAVSDSLTIFYPSLDASLQFRLVAFSQFLVSQQHAFLKIPTQSTCPSVQEEGGQREP